MPQQNHKPPPIFIHGVINYNQMIKSISEVAEDEQYFTKGMANNVIKLTFIIIIIIIIIIFIDCNWVYTRWQWSFSMLHMHGLCRLIILI